MKKAMAVASKELRQIMRDRRTLLILLFVPAFFLLLFGYALNFDIRNVSLAVQDQDRSTKSRELVSSFVNSGYFTLVGYVDSPAEMNRLIDEGHARAILSIPPGFEHDLSVRQPVTVQVIIDGDNANTASTVMGYARTLLGEYRLARDSVADVGSRLPAPGAGAGYHRRAAHLVQPAAAQHPVPGAGIDCIHLDDHRGGVNRAVGSA